MDLIGQNLSDFTDSGDYVELMKSNQDREDGGTQRMILRMKTILTPRGRNLNLKSAVYKVRVDSNLKSLLLVRPPNNDSY